MLIKVQGDVKIDLCKKFKDNGIVIPQHPPIVPPLGHVHNCIQTSQCKHHTQVKLINHGSTGKKKNRATTSPGRTAIDSRVQHIQDDDVEQ